MTRSKERYNLITLIFMTIWPYKRKLQVRRQGSGKTRWMHYDGTWGHWILKIETWIDFSTPTTLWPQNWLQCVYNMVLRFWGTCLKVGGTCESTWCNITIIWMCWELWTQWRQSFFYDTQRECKGPILIPSLRFHLKFSLVGSDVLGKIQSSQGNNKYLYEIDVCKIEIR